jgi:hypothetical protein
MRHAVWGLLATGCFERAIEADVWRERCPRAEPLARVAQDEPILLDWSALEGGDTVDGLVLGRLPVPPLELQSQSCRDQPRDDYDQTEVVHVEPGELSVLLEPEHVGPVGTTTRVTLRSLDEVLATMLVAPIEDGTQTEVTFR